MLIPAALTNPVEFLSVGQRVRALVDIIEEDFNGNDFVHATKGELGTCVFMEPGYLPTVQFDRTGTSTIVCEDEVALVGSPAGSFKPTLLKD